mmetsp:Transcript_28688/g.73305  ORF Transcript_28688/g.73305 Transcript_28688/m.73305 type:complete len:150 (-) Transcript_28688:1329-1778(-)
MTVEKVQAHYYVKAAYLGVLRKFKKWEEGKFSGKNEFPTKAGYTDEEFASMKDDTVVYIQADYRVTKSPIITENTIIYDKITPQWVGFVNKRLRFKLPDPNEDGEEEEEDEEEEEKAETKGELKHGSDKVEVEEEVLDEELDESVDGDE